MQITDAAMTPVFESIGLRYLGGARAEPKAVESPDGGQISFVHGREPRYRHGNIF